MMDSKRAARLVLAFYVGVFISLGLLVPWVGLVLVLTLVIFVFVNSLLWAIDELR